MSQPRIFVSHSHKDDAFTERLVADLRQAGANAWMDKTDLGAGDFQDRISQALSDCEWFVLVLTKDGLESKWVRQEVNVANILHHQGQIHDLIFIQAGPVQHPDMPAFWRVFNIFDATQEYEAARDRVLKAVGLSPLVQPASVQPKPPGYAQLQDDVAFTAHMQLTDQLTAQEEVELHTVEHGRQPEQKVEAPPIPADRFPQRLADLGFTTDSNNGVEYILPPLVPVPAGSFLMGSDSKRDPVAKKEIWTDPEKPPHTVTLPAYEIARFPVTVAEYACFVRFGHAEPYDWQTQPGKLEHPVVNVRWHDAVAYAAWLSERTGERWRLPTEAEWEKAARGTDGRIYSWGDIFDKARCNTSESGIGTTTPVGKYPSSTSLYGVEDMAGNVWEWTASRYLPYPYTLSGEREDPNSTDNLVLRGGSFVFDARFARAAYRLDFSPVTFYGFLYFGFRLVRAAPNS